jgi:hypothetical protein
MALQSTGSEWNAVYGATWNPLGIRKGLITNILIRDYNGAATNLRDSAAGLNTNGLFTPYATDGLYRTDLLDPSFSGGQFYDVGALKDDGIKLTPDVSVEGVKVAQARRAQRYDITDENDEIMFTCRESNPVVDALRFDLALAGLGDAGSPGYTVTKPSESDLIERQIIALAEDGNNRFAYVFPRVSRKKVGATQLNRKDPDDLELTYGALICPFVDAPIYIVREGSGWRSLAGSVIWASTPVATSASATTATVTFTKPRLSNDPQPDAFTYTVERKTGAGAWTAATVSGSPTVSGSTVTVTVSGLTTATAYTFRVTATAAGSQAATSAVSNSITTS